MKNPWLAKNPFLSMWMSAANSMLGAARGHAMSHARRQQATMMNEAGKTVLSAWTGATPAAKSRKRRRAS